MTSWSIGPIDTRGREQCGPKPSRMGKQGARQQTGAPAPKRRARRRDGDAEHLGCRRARRLLFVWLVSAAVITLAPFGPLRAAPAPLRMLLPGAHHLGLFDLFANVALFLPFGALAVRSGQRRWFAILLGLALTLGIESTQRFLAPRFPSWLDVAANTAGATLGALWSNALIRGAQRLDRAPLRWLALAAGTLGAFMLLQRWPGGARYTVLLPFAFAVLGASLAAGLWRPPLASLLTLLGVVTVCTAFWGPPAPLLVATVLGGAALGAWPYDMRPARAHALPQ